MPERIPQSTAIRVPLQAYLSSDHVTPATGKTIAITLSKNGAAYGNPSGGATNATSIGSGSYYVDLSTTDAGTLGPLLVKGTEGTIDNIIAIYDVVADPIAVNVTQFGGHAVGLDSHNYPGVNIVDVGGTAASVAGTVDANVTKWHGANVVTPNTPGVPIADVAFPSFSITGVVAASPTPSATAFIWA